jgi:hypothetical protein
MIEFSDQNTTKAQERYLSRYVKDFENFLKEVKRGKDTKNTVLIVVVVWIQRLEQGRLRCTD